MQGDAAEHKRYNGLMNIGVDIGGSKILVATGDNKGAITRRAKVITPVTAETGLLAIATLIDEVCGDAKPTAIAVVAPGPLDITHGLMLPSPNLQWGEVAICQQLQKRYDCPVTLENDANAAALAEATLGAAQKQPVALYVTLSTGIGTGLVINGKIYHGAHDIEGGHMIIPTIDADASHHRSEFEQASSGPATIRRFGKPGYEITDKTVWDIYSRDLSVGLFNLMTIISPSVVVLGGGLSVHYPKFHDQLLQHLKELPEYYPLPPIVQAKLVEEAPITGALLLANRLS